MAKSLSSAAKAAIKSGALKKVAETNDTNRQNAAKKTPIPSDNPRPAGTVR